MDTLSKEQSATAFCTLSGMTNKQIARFLGVGVPCVASHLSAVCRKLGLADKRQIAVYLLTGYKPAAAAREGEG